MSKDCYNVCIYALYMLASFPGTSELQVKKYIKALVRVASQKKNVIILICEFNVVSYP